MTSLRMTAPARLIGTLLLVPALSLLGACGDDPEATSTDTTTGEASAEPTFTPDGDGEVVDEIGEAIGAGDDVDEALDAMGEEGVADALGKSLVSALTAATDYELQDDRLVLTMDGSASENTSACIIATTARDGLGNSIPITLAFDDGDVDC